MVRKLSVLIGLVCISMGLQNAAAQSPPEPTNLVATLVATIPPSVHLNWEASRPAARESFFKVYRSLEDSLHFNLAGVTSDTFYNDRAVFAGHTYFYRVTLLVVVNDSTVLESDPSNTASVVFPPPPDRPHGLIMGTVRDSATGKPLPHILMMFFCRSHTLLWIQQAWTDSLGHYSAVLDTGWYFILARPLQLPWAVISTSNSWYRPQWYDHVYDPKYATAVKADSPASVANFDLSKPMPPPVARLSGYVRDTEGNPLANAFVAILRAPWEMALAGARLGIADLDTSEDCEVEDLGVLRGVVWKGWTGIDGKYTAALPAGRSYIALAVKRMYLPQFYDHKRCILDATVIRIPVTTTDTRGFDFNLKLRPILVNSISGVVQDSNGVRVPSHILVIPVPGQGPGPIIRFGNTDLSGAYTIRFIPTGMYKVLAIPHARYAPAFYKAGAYGVIRWQNADTVLVNGPVTGIDVGVVPVHCGGVAVIAGRVLSVGAPVEGAVVLATDAAGQVVGYGMTDDNGSYGIDGIPVGDLTLSVHREGYESAAAMLPVATVDFRVQKDFSLETTTAVGEEPMVPATYSLDQNYPNPFNPTTVIRYSLPAMSQVRLAVFDMLGRQVSELVNEKKEAGSYEVRFDATGLASGVYFYRIEAGNFVQTRKLLLLR